MVSVKHAKVRVEHVSALFRIADLAMAHTTLALFTEVTATKTARQVQYLKRMVAIASIVSKQDVIFASWKT